ncbi:hypothetical protein CLU79DRAFT_738564 [Phycomyces nitens]|nr:hypothetical protein CLU79DRAFT_738564 [Phycomyces nitens]
MNPVHQNDPHLSQSAGLDSATSIPANAKKTRKPKKNPEDDDSGDDSEDGEDKPVRRSGRRKIKIEYIEDKNRRHITFSKRKAGIMKKAYELSTLTGTQVLLLVVSETGLVYTFTTVKLQPMVTKPEGKNLIQACLNAPDPASEEAASEAGYSNGQPSPRTAYKEKEPYGKKVEPSTPLAPTFPPSQEQNAAPAQTYQAQPSYGNYGHTGYMNAPPPGHYQQHPTQPTQQQQQQQQQHPSQNQAQQHQQHQPHQQHQQPSPQQHQQQQPYGQIPSPAFYNNQQHYMPQHHQQHQPGGHGGYWSNGSVPGTEPSMARQQEHGGMEDPARRMAPAPGKK